MERIRKESDLPKKNWESPSIQQKYSHTKLTQSSSALYFVEFSTRCARNEDTLLPTHCCPHKCFPVCPRVQHLSRTQILCPGHKNVSDFVQKHFVSATNVSQFARARKRHEQQCVRNNVSSFATALMNSVRTRDAQ